VAGFASYDDEISETTSGGKILRWHGYKRCLSTSTAGNLYNTWDASDGDPTAMATPANAASGGTTHTNEPGLIYWANQTPDKKFLSYFGIAADAQFQGFLADVLWSCSAISITSTGQKTITSPPTLPRYAGAASKGNVAIVTITTQTATTNPQLRAIYTDETGATGITGDTVLLTSATVGVRNAFMLPLSRVSRGIDKLEALDVVAAPTAGEVMVQIVKILKWCPMPNSNQPNRRCFRSPHHKGAVRIFDGASLGLFGYTGGSVTPKILFSVGVNYG
jgi:hypothetical protein